MTLGLPGPFLQSQTAHGFPFTALPFSGPACLSCAVNRMLGSFFTLPQKLWLEPGSLTLEEAATLMCVVRFP